MSDRILKSIENRFKAVFELIQLMEIEEYGCCRQIKDCGQGVVLKLYEMDCRTYIVKYVDGDSVGFIRVTTCKK